MNDSDYSEYLIAARKALATAEAAALNRLWEAAAKAADQSAEAADQAALWFYRRLREL